MKVIYFFVNKSAIILVILSESPAFVSDSFSPFNWPIHYFHSICFWQLFLSFQCCHHDSHHPGLGDLITTARLIPNLSSSIMSFFFSSLPKTQYCLNSLKFESNQYFQIYPKLFNFSKLSVLTVLWACLVHYYLWVHMIFHSWNTFSPSTNLCP